MRKLRPAWYSVSSPVLSHRRTFWDVKRDQAELTLYRVEDRKQRDPTVSDSGRV